MGFWFSCFSVTLVLAIVSNSRSVVGIRFNIDREECFSHLVPNQGDVVHVSFVVIKAENRWNYGEEDGVDLSVMGPTGDQIRDSRDKINEKFEFVAQNKGLHHFCFSNNSPYHEHIDFGIHLDQFAHFDQHAKADHVSHLLVQIAKVEEALVNIQFKQYWLKAQTDRQALVNEGMSQRALHKAMFESIALIGTSILQVYLLHCLIERKQGSVRV